MLLDFKHMRLEHLQDKKNNKVAQKKDKIVIKELKKFPIYKPTL